MGTHHAEQTLERDSAAEDLAGRLKGLADFLGASLVPRQVRYGHSRLGKRFRTRSPHGFITDSANLQLLLPDGRLWSYGRGDAYRFPNGRFYDPRVDHVDYASARTFPGGTEFSFLGAVIGKYSFGVANVYGEPGLCALASDGASVRYVHPDEAFEDLAMSLLSLGAQMG